MYVVWLLVFWRNVLNVSNFYIKCKSILNKGGLFPLCVLFFFFEAVQPTSDQTGTVVIFLWVTWALTWQVNQQHEVFCLLHRGRWLIGDHCPPYMCMKANPIHYLLVGTQHQYHPLNDNSLFFYFTYNGCFFTHFTSSFTMATRGGSVTTALSPYVRAIGWICQHTQHTAFWWLYKWIPYFSAFLIVLHL